MRACVRACDCGAARRRSVAERAVSVEDEGGSARRATAPRCTRPSRRCTTCPAARRCAAPPAAFAYAHRAPPARAACNGTRYGPRVTRAAAACASDRAHSPAHRHARRPRTAPCARAHVRAFGRALKAPSSARRPLLGRRWPPCARSGTSPVPPPAARPPSVRSARRSRGRS